VGGIKYKMNVDWASAVSSAERWKHETQRPIIQSRGEPGDSMIDK